MTPQPSEVWTFQSPTAPRGELKFKHHLCIGIGGSFLFISTHRERKRSHRGTMIIPNSDVPFLPPTETGRSEISCTTIVSRAFPDPTVPKHNPRGIVERRLMGELVRFIRASKHITDDERYAILDDLYDYYGAEIG